MDTAQMEARHKSPFGSTMFDSSNKTAMEVVVHFLLTKLDPSAAAEAFKFCWPIMDHRQEKAFRKEAGDWLKRIAETVPSSGINKLAPAILLSPQGHKIYRLLLRLSNHVLRVRMQQQYQTPPERYFETFDSTAVSSSYLPVAANALEAQSRALCDRFVRQAQRQVNLQQRWRSYAATLTRAYRDAEKALEEQRRDAVALHVDLKHVELPTLENTPVLERTRQLWAKIQSFFDTTEVPRAIVERILAGEANQLSLNSDEIPVTIPDVIVEACEQQLRRGKIEGLRTEGKLNLLGFLHMWNIALQHLKASLGAQGEQPDIRRLLPVLVSLVQAHREAATRTATLAKSLHENVIPELMRLCDELQPDEGGAHSRNKVSAPATPSHRQLGRLPETPHVASLGRRLQIQTPEASDSAVPLRDPALFRVPSIAFRSPMRIATPIAVENILREAQRRSPGRSRPTIIPEPSAAWSPSPARSKARAGETSKVTSNNKGTGPHHVESSPIRDPASALAPSPKRAARDEQDPSVRTRHYETHQDLLADQLVAEAFQDEIDARQHPEQRVDGQQHQEAAEGRQLHAVTNPLEALDDHAAFASRDLLSRTPAHGLRRTKARPVPAAMPPTDEGDAWKYAYASLDPSLPTFDTASPESGPHSGRRPAASPRSSPRLRRHSSPRKTASAARSNGRTLQVEPAQAAVRFDLSSEPQIRVEVEDNGENPKDVRPHWHSSSSFSFTPSPTKSKLVDDSAAAEVKGWDLFSGQDGSPSREEAQNLLDVSLGLIDDPLDEAETLLHGFQLQPSDAAEMAADLDSTFTAMSLTHGTPRRDDSLEPHAGGEMLETAASAYDTGYSGGEEALALSPAAPEPERQQPFGMASPSRSFAKGYASPRRSEAGSRRSSPAASRNTDLASIKARLERIKRAASTTSGSMHNA